VIVPHSLLFCASKAVIKRQFNAIPAEAQFLIYLPNCAITVLDSFWRSQTFHLVAVR